MAVPRFVFAFPFVVLGAVAPGLTHREPLPRRSNVVGMEQVEFDRDAITIRQGQQIEFVNNSNFLHVIAPGDRARVSDGAGVPSFGPDQRAIDATWRPVRHRAMGHARVRTG